LPSRSYWPLADDAELAAYGFDDSKALTHERREALFARMGACGKLGYVTHALSSLEISAAMLRRAPVSLNALSHDAAMEMLEAVLAAGVRVEQVFVDTVGDAGWYEKKLGQVFNSGGGGGGGAAGRGWTIDFTVTKRADSLFKVVSAASIAAKVVRDRALPAWVFEEPALAHVTPQAPGPEVLAAAAPAAAAAASGGGSRGGAEEEEEEGVVVAGAKGKAARVEAAPAAAGATAAAAPAAAAKASAGEAGGEDEDEDEEADFAIDLEEDYGEGPAEAPAAAAPAAAAAASSSSSSSSSKGAAKKRPRAAPAPAAPRAVTLHPRSAGSGYPSDPATKAWVGAFFDALFGWPSIVRFSWAPAKDALEKRGVKCVWAGEEGAGGGGVGQAPGQGRLTAFFSATSSGGAGGGGSGGGAGGGGGAAAKGSAGQVPVALRAGAGAGWMRRHYLAPLAAL